MIISIFLTATLIPFSPAKARASGEAKLLPPDGGGGTETGVGEGGGADEVLGLASSVFLGGGASFLSDFLGLGGPPSSL